MSSVSINSNCSFGGTVEVDGDVTLQSALAVTDVSTHYEDIVIKNGTTTTVTLAKEGRIALGDSYGNTGQVLTSGGASGSLSWEDASGGTVESQFNANSTNAVSATAIDTYSAQTYAKLAGGNTIAGSNTFSGTGNIFSQRVLFTNGFEVAVATPKLQVGAVSGSSLSAFTSGSISDTRLEVDDGNLVVKGTHTTGSGDAQTTVKNAVYSDEYKNLAGEKIIVPSSTAFDPTEDERTGTMKAIRDYIGTFIDIVPPVFAGGRFTGEQIVGGTITSITQTGSDIDGETAGDQSGWNVAMNLDGTILAVGAYGNDGTGADAGHVRVYQLSNGTWSQLGADIDGEATGDYSGYSVSLNSDGTILAVGAIFNDGTSSNAGHVRVYQFSSNSWIQLGGDIDGKAANDWSGHSVSLSSDGTVLAVGAIFNNTANQGTGYCRVYQFSSNSWTQLGGDIDGEASGDRSGWSVSLNSDGTILAVGATWNDGTGDKAGHVRAYQFSSNSWTQLGGDIDGEAANDQSGYSVSLSSDGTILAIGAVNNNSAVGHCRVYKFSSGSWSQLGADIDGEANSDNFGISVSLSADGTVLAVGARFNDGTSSNAGHCRVYEYDGSWTQIGNDLDGEAADDQFGNALALSGYGNRLAIGGPLNDGTGTDAGHVRAFELVGRMRTATGTVTASVGDTFNPFTGNGTVTCTDSPTAGPNKGTTQTFTLGADNFEFRNQIEGNLDDFGVPFSTSVVPIANVFNNLSNGAWQASSTWKTAGTYYLRYKATDAAGNDTPNDADHYLTVTVSS